MQQQQLHKLHNSHNNLNPIIYPLDCLNEVYSSRSFSSATTTIPTTKTSNACIISTTIPCEIFIEICRYLHPVELVNLTFVCKKFRRWLLAVSNFGTEQIWKFSRTTYLPNLPAAPKGLPEQCYVFLHLIELGCQFCGKGRIDQNGDMPSEQPAKIYWEFKVRCCRSCFFNRTISRGQLKEEGRLNREALVGLPFYSQASRPKLYWRSQDIKIVKLLESNLITAQCQQSSKPEPLKKWHQKARLKSVISRLSTSVPNDANRSIERVEAELRRCPTYKKYTLKNPEATVAMRFFSDHHWDSFQNAIREEYIEKRNYAAIRARQFDLFVKVNSMVSIQIPSNHPIFEYLVHCPSFKQPSFHSSDPSIPWSETYLTQTLIPKLCEEVFEFSNNTNNSNINQKSIKIGKKLPPTITMIAKGHFLNRKIFSCKLCSENVSEYSSRKKSCVFNFNDIKIHLQLEHDHFAIC
ncbi:22505_t:CDS:2 [Entrophospora sp. SA101]|nr:22505_t:CDS:2 [Entrophospora sp. SA101]